MTFYRNILTASFVLLIGLASLACQTSPTKKGASIMNGKIIITEKGSVKIHSYISPEDSTLVTSHIVESKNELVLVDAQFIRPYAQEVKDYIEHLKKPLNRIIVTHSHPDHWFGLELFKNVPIYSLKKTAQEIEELGDVIIKSKKPVLGDLVTDSKTVPDHNIVPNTSETIDGVTYRYEKIDQAEAGVQLLIRLKDQNVLIVQDLGFNKVHLFIGQQAFASWINTATQLSKESNNTSVLVGHGEPTTPNVFATNIAYLNDAATIFGSAQNGEDLKRQLMEKYPEYRSALLLDISNDFLYQKK